jgi:ubiquinone/menaquinone biosynthesis C-methylase UbiE
MNIDKKTVEDFGREWENFDQTGLTSRELESIFSDYFSLMPAQSLPRDAIGFDLGCGSGRWAQFVLPHVEKLHCIDASEKALAVARRNLVRFHNATFFHASVDAIPLADDSMDFGYSLGVLHHVPDTQAGLISCVKKLKTGAPFLVYLYYALEFRPIWNRALWRASDLLRRSVSVLPHAFKLPVSTAVAALAYLPLARAAMLFEGFGVDVSHWPLSFYRTSSFYTMRTDALDRFGTRLEQRFTRDQIMEMMTRAGLKNIRFRESAPYWCAVGTRG